MTKEEFLQKATEIVDWAPGWDAIDSEFARIYSDQKPMHFGTEMHARAMFGGDQYLGLGGHALDGGNSEITALLVVADTEAQTQDTVYGRTEFLQLVGITQPELLALKQNSERVSELVEKLRLLNPDFVTDMNRTESLIK